MLPASDLTEILTNLAALNLQPNTAAQVLTAVLTPLLRSSGSPELEDLRKDPRPTPKRPYRRAGRARARGIRPRKYKRHAPTEARDRALAALKANPEATVTEIAKAAGCSRSTVTNAAKDLAAETRKRRPGAKREREHRGKRPIRRPTPSASALRAS